MPHPKNPLSSLTGKFLLALVCGLMIGALLPLSGRAETNPPTDWQSTLDRDHPLVGKIWSRVKAGTVTPAQLVDAIATAPYVLIGEVHDNGDHHKLQGWLISQMSTRGRRPAVIMEMIRKDKGEALKAYLEKGNATTDGLRRVLEWDKSGWPSWSIYEPIARAALDAGLVIAPGDAPRKEIRTIGRKGFKFIGPARAARLTLDKPLGPALEKALMEELVESHCNLMPASALKPMNLVQRFRDATLADAMLSNDRRDGAILITGNGHARSDRAVPWYLSRRAPAKTSITIVLVEADKEAKTIKDLAPLSPSGEIAADYVWVTPRAKREDQCEALRKMFADRARKKKKSP